MNVGNFVSPSFDTASVIFAGIEPGFRCSPVFIDIDNDLDLDIVSGYSGGGIKLYVNNNGTFSENTTMFANVSVNYHSIPAFADIDGDNDPDLLVGSDDAGNTKFYINDGNNSFTQNTTFFSGVNFPGSCRPAFADIDNDGDYDLFIGRSSGGVDFYENTGDRFNPVWTLNNQLTSDVKVKQFAHPGFVDLDGDGRIDLIVGEYDGNFTYYKNLFAVVPVELTSFNALVNQDKVLLKWETATETNNKGFEIERQTNKLQWVKIGYAAGFGTTTESKSYSFTDGNVSHGIYCYRLKQIDFDGTGKYSKVVEVNVALPDEFSLSQNFPNPFNPATQIEYSITENEFVSLKVYNTLGQLVENLVNENIKAGNHTVTFDGTNLSSGVYYYRLEAGNKVLVKKMLITK
jgi:hypothetical protein